MNREQAAKDLLYPSIELRLVEPIIHPGEEDGEVLETTTVQEIICPKCESSDLWKRGLTAHDEQKYSCRTCNHRFYLNQKWKISERNDAVKCQYCSSSNWYKRGITENGRQNYSCQDCRKFFGIHPLVDKDGRDIKCPDCESKDYNLHGKDRNSKQVYKCRNCCRQYILNPRGQDDLNHLNDINCRWYNSKNFTRFGVSKAGKQQCICKDCHKQFTVGAERPDILVAPEKFDFDYDVWTAEHLGYENGIHKHYKINFEYIEQPWLKQYFKKFILYLSSTRLAFATLNGKVQCINIFSKFLKDISYHQEFEGITRALIIDYFAHLKIHKYSDSTYTHCISTVKTFFETGTFNFWFNVEPALIRPEDWLRLKKGLPRFIPEEVMKQLSQHIDGLPDPVMRMALVDIECGFRIGELTRLAIDCLKSDGKGGWYVQYYMSKMKKDCSKPISIELAKVIQEQQTYIKEVLGNDFTYLFCGRARGKSEEFIPEPKLMTSTSFVEHIKRLARKHEIKDNLGKLWNFQTHQFRHTVGTRMINAGVPQHIVQKYLGHECPQMTMRYAHIHDATLRKEIEKYHESTPVNFQGEAVELEETILSSSNDLEWFTKNVQPRALEHGYCGRPRLLGDCDIPGFDGCYNCPHWRTNKSFLPILQDTLDRTNKVLEKAQMAGWELQVKKNEPIKHNLEKVIKSLEADSHE